VDDHDAIYSQIDMIVLTAYINRGTVEQFNPKCNASSCSEWKL